MVNYAQAYYIDNDIEMYDPETDTPALARTSSLNADLGQIEWIFSDKTGTLTCNEMKLRRCSVGGIKYGHTEDRGEFKSESMVAALKNTVNTTMKRKKELENFWTCLSVCHTVVVEEEDVVMTEEEKEEEKENLASTKRNENTDYLTRPTRATSSSKIVPNGLKKRVYRAESPDEGALVEGAACMGFVLLERTNTKVSVKRVDNDIQNHQKNSNNSNNSNKQQEHRNGNNGEVTEHTIVAINAFNSTRKRMSVLTCVQSKSGQKDNYVLWIKGADNVMMERAQKNTLKKELSKHLSDFASEGLRTLVLGKRTVSKTQAEQWLNNYHAALESVEDRKGKLAKAAEEIETNLEIVGITAIEDRLQDGVPDTIRDLLRAGIKLW